MSKSDWERADIHPTPELLLRYWEFDLPDGEMAELKAHLQRCWSCSAELENLKQGVWSFIGFREKVLLPSVPIDLSTSPVRRALLAASSVDSPATPAWKRAIGSFFTLISAADLRPAWIAGAVSVAAIFAFAYFAMMSPVPLLASEFIHNVHNSLAQARRSEEGKLVFQRLRLRCDRLVTERQIILGRQSASSAPAVPQPLWVGSMPDVLTWDDPLGFDSIVKWRARQTSFSENISIDSGLVTLRLTVTGPGAAVDENVREVLVSARRVDWHIGSKRVEFRYGPSLEATETAYSVVEPSASIAGTKSANTVLPAGTTRPSPARPADLHRTEVRVRKILFQDRADLAFAEAPLSLTRTPTSIRIDGVISAPAARSELKRALAALPYVSNKIRSAVAVRAPLRLPRSVHAVLANPNEKEDDKEIVDPPLLRKKLIESLGSEQQATEFANRILEESGKSFSLSAQYRDLAQHFRFADEKFLAADVRFELDNLAREMESALRTQLNEEAVLLTPILGNELRAEPTTDPDWHNRADTLFRLASLKQRVVSRLFAVTGHAALVEASADAEVAQLRICIQDMRASIS
jgi:hypothetical protein